MLAKKLRNCEQFRAPPQSGLKAAAIGVVEGDSLDVTFLPVTQCQASFITGRFNVPNSA